jgi:chromosome segregation ATPase
MKMTPEERFTKMENLLHGMLEHQVHQQDQLDRQSQPIDKQNAGNRDLIVVSRTLLTTTEKIVTSMAESQKEVTQQIKELREAQAEAHAAIDEKLNILIDTVDRIIRNLGKNGSKQ